MRQMVADHLTFGVPAYMQVPPQYQVLILRDESDDNLDRLLWPDKDWLTLRECGLSHDSLLTLHTLQRCVRTEHDRVNRYHSR